MDTNMTFTIHKTVVQNKNISHYVFAHSNCIWIIFIFTLFLPGVFGQEKHDQPAAYLFSYFKKNGEDGLHLAYSQDGLKWTALKEDTSFLRPQVGSKLMRDPSICQGPDGMFHVVWTTGWWDKGIGIAHSKDLINWSEQTFLPAMVNEAGAKNCWAPEIFYDETSKQYLIFWATTIPGRFSQTEASGDNNHRIYIVTTSDFKQYSKTRLFYDPGFNVIDSFIANDNGCFVMFLKDETKQPVAQKNIRTAFSTKAEGPYGPASEPITGRYWAEGPTAVKIDGRWFVYFDKYTQNKYGALTSGNLKDWEDISNKVEFPKGTRHGTAFKVNKKTLDNLIEYSGEKITNTENKKTN
jgi:hypothetical protein